MAKPCRVVVSPQLAEVLNLEPNQDLSYREWVQILHDGGLDKLADRALVALGEVKKGAKESVELQNELEVREQRSMNEPRDAKDVAIIFRRLFNFSPFEAVAAARIFDAKAARMSKLLGISKEDYYKRYWFTGEQEGGLSQIIGEQGAARVENALPNLEKAKSMYGKEPNWKIKRDTGWEKGIDGKWRFEISPVSLRSDFIIDENSVWNHVNEADGNQVVFNLNEVADMSILEQLYPSLKNAEFVFTKMKSGDRGAIIKTKDGKTIVYVNANEFIKDGTLDRDELRKTIVHEVQHGIQDIERFAQGTNLSAANKQVQNEIKEINDLLESGNINFYEKLKLLYKKRKLSKESKFGRYLRTAGEVEARNVVKRISFSDISRAVNTLKETEDIKRKNQIVITEDSLKSNSKLFQTDSKESLSQMTLPDGREVTVKRMSPEVVNGFYSPIEKNLMEYGKDKIKAKDWLNVVGKGDEAVFTGVRAFLEGKDPNAMVSKQEILDYMKDNRISVVEVVKDGSEDVSMANNRNEALEALNNGNDLTDLEGWTITKDKLDNKDLKYPLIIIDKKPPTKFSQYQLEGEKENYKEIMVILPRTGSMAKVGDYKVPSAHQYGEDLSDNRRLVHLRMNTRTDADGNKVLFLEEVQSDWGQLGKKEGFADETKKAEYEKLKKEFESLPAEKLKIPLSPEIEAMADKLDKLEMLAGKGATPTAPFVMDTNAWTKLGLKVALKEAVAQGVDKIAWTTGEQQNDRYSLEKIADELRYSKNSDGTYKIIAYKEGENVSENRNVKEKDLDSYFGKDVAQRIIDGVGEDIEGEKSLIGENLKVGGKGMKGFYGSMEEGTKGIVGGVAEKVFGQKVGETKIDTGVKVYDAEKYNGTQNIETIPGNEMIQDGDWLIKNLSGDFVYSIDGYLSKSEAIQEFKDTAAEAGIVISEGKGLATQPSVDITPELKAQVQEGLPLFQGDRKGAWSKEAAKAKRIISMYQKADSTTQAHEVVGHDFLDEIIQLSSTNEEMAEDLNTIVDEFIKETGSKVSKEKLLKDLKDFDVEKKQNKNGKDIHEWFAESAERYFATERGAREGAGFSKKMVALFEKFRQYMADLYSKMNKELVEPSPAMKQIFRKIFGAENFAEAEEMRKATFDRMNSLQASELEMNYSKSKPKLSDIINKYKPKEGLGQLSDDFVQDMYNAASIIVKDGEATRWNVTNKLQELMPHLKSEIEQLRKVLQEVGTKGNLRGGVENLLANPYITDEIKEKIAKLSEYTPESMAKVGLNAEQILSYYIGEADNNDIVGMQTVAKLLAEGKFDGFTEKVALRQLLIANYNQLAKITKDENKRIDYVNAAVDQAEAYAIEGTGMGRMINMYKALGSLTADGLIVWAKRQEMKFTKPSFERFKSEIKDLKKRLKKAQEDIDYFFEQVVGREETEAQYKEVIAAYQAEIDALKSRKPKEPKASKSAYRNVKNKAISITDDAYKSAINALKSSKLFQDLSNLTPAQTVAYYLMERKPMNISQFAKEFSKALDKKVDPSELRELYQQTRDMLILKDIGYAEGLSANEELEKDLQDLEDTKRAKIEELERKKAAAEAELAAMKTQMSEKDKEVKAKEALKRREKEIRDKFLDSLSQDGLWQQYVKSAAGRVLGNLGSKLGAKQSEKALLDEFTQLATRELNKAIDELMPKQKGGKGATPNYAQQLGDLIANQEKLADIFDKAVKDFAEKNEGNANAQSILSKLNGLKNPFSEKLMENALEKEAQNYAIKISDLAYNYAGLRGVLKDQIVAQIVAETGLKGQQAAQLEQDLKNKFDSIIAEAKSSTADKLSNFVLSDLKRAMSGTLPKQKTYVEELLSALTQKAKEVALKGEKGTQRQAPITPIEAIKKALDAIQNGKPDASIWNDAVEQVKQKIEQDPDLSQQDKEDLNLYLNDYTSFVYDNMLNDSVILKAIKENLIANGYGSGNTVNFKALIVADGQAQMQERQRLIEKLKQDLSQYDPIQVEKVLDAIAERYQRLINEKRKQIADEYINQTFKTKSPSTRRAIRGTIGKLIMENRMGLFDDTNNAILDALAEKKGFANMTSDDWAKIKEYADLVEALPLDSNLQNEALEEMTAFVRTKMPGRWLLIATAVRYGVLLGRITSNIKNAVGGFEQALTLTLARAMRGDTEFGKSALKGFGQGDFKDVLIGGGINQANRISVEADANGMPRFRVLEYLKPKTIGGKVVESVKYSGRMLDAMDAIWQKFFTSGYDIKYMRKLLELENPNATKQEIDDMVGKIFLTSKYKNDYIKRLLKLENPNYTNAEINNRLKAIKNTGISDAKYLRDLLAIENPNYTQSEIDQRVNDILSRERVNDYMDQATKEVIASGKKVTEAKVRRRAYEIMRDSLVRPIAKQLSDFESTEKTYKTDFAENKGVGTGAGFVALYIANASKQIVEWAAKFAMEVRGDTKELAEEKAKIYSSIIPNFILPFSKGLSGFIEKGLERELIYGLTKSIAVSIAAKSKTPTTIEEKMAQYRAIEKAKDIATSAVVTNLILYGIGGILYAMSKQWEDDEEKEGRYHPKTGVYGKAKPMTIKGVTVKEKAEPENVIVLFGKEIPLSYVGGLGVTAMVDANLYKAFTEETDERKKTKAMEVASNFGTAALYTMDSFLSQAWLMQASDNKSITEMIQEGNTERALNLIQNTMINYMGSYIPWSGFINQSLQGARELSGGETYQEAKTISEKIQKQFGLAGITYTNTKKNYLGEDIKYSDVNKEGIIGLVNMFKTKSISAEDNWLRNIGFKEKASGQYAKGLKDLDGYSPSIEEYDRYDDRTKSMFGIIAKEAYNQKANIVPLPNEINRVTKKPYTVDEFQSKVMRSALSAVSKYNIVRLKKERGDYNSDKDAYEEDMENAFYNLDEVADIIYYKKGDEYKNRKRKKDALIDKVTEIK